MLKVTSQDKYTNPAGTLPEQVEGIQRRHIQEKDTRLNPSSGVVQKKEREMQRKGGWREKRKGEQSGRLPSGVKTGWRNSRVSAMKVSKAKCQLRRFGETAELRGLERGLWSGAVRQCSLNIPVFPSGPQPFLQSGWGHVTYSCHRMLERKTQVLQCLSHSFAHLQKQCMCSKMALQQEVTNISGQLWAAARM